MVYCRLLWLVLSGEVVPCLLAAGGMLAKKKTAGIVSDDLRSVVHNGGDEGDRTPDLLNAIQALSQLSYAPVQYV